jgi:hypothetical protein
MTGRKSEAMIPEYLDVPIFPLPNVTFFPNTVLPLHVFEPRYREMIQTCMRGDRHLGVALLREGWQKDYFGNPPIHKTFGIGKIVDCEPLDDGCFDIIVEGLYRARLVVEHPTTPFRTGRVNVLQDGPIDHRRKEVEPIHKELIGVSAKIADALPDFSESIQSALAGHPHPSVAADVLASTLVVDAYDRQSILEEPNPIRRLKLVLVQLRRILAQATSDHVEEEVFEED